MGYSRSRFLGGKYGIDGEEGADTQLDGGVA